MFRAHAPLQGPCENLRCALKLLAKLQADGDNLVVTIFEGSQEHRRLKITNELRKLTEVDNHEAVKIGDLQKHSEAIKVIKHKFNKEIYQNAAVREGVGELTLREGEEATLRSIITPLMWGPADGDHRLWKKIGVSFAEPSTRVSRERNGRSCTASSWR